MKTKNIVLLTALCTFCFATTTLAQEQLSFPSDPNISLAITLNPGKAKAITNPLWWAISASCTITKANNDSEIAAKKTAGTIKINGIDVSNTYKLTVSKNTVFTIWASSGASVKLTNNSSEDVVANCNTTAIYKKQLNHTIAIN